MATPEAKLVQRVLTGDREAYGDLVNRYRDMVYGLCYYLTHDFEAARDLTQEAFIQAYLRLAQLRDPDKFAGWLRRIALHVHRAQLRHREVATVTLEEAQTEMRAPHASEIEIVVREALGKLAEPERLALTLHYINGYTHAEIGSFLGVRAETVNTRLARARQHLRKEIMAMVEDTFDKKKLPEEFTKETVEAAIRRAEGLLRDGKLGEAYWEYMNVVKDVGIAPTMKGYRDLLRDNENYVPALIGLGFAHREAGEAEDALRNLRRALELDPDNRLAWTALEQVLSGRQRFEEANALYEERQKVRPDPPALYHAMRGSNFMPMGKMAEAEREFRLALAAEPHDAQPAAMYLLGIVLRDTGRFDESVAVLHEAADKNPDDEHIRWQLALAYRAAGQLDQAIACLRESLLMTGQGNWGMRVECPLVTLECCYHDKGQLETFPDTCRELRDQMTDKDRAARVQWYLAQFLESRLLKDEALTEFQSLGAIPARCWRVISPFDNTGGHGMSTVYPPEEVIDLDAAYTGLMGRRIGWECPRWDGAGFELNFLWHVPEYTRSEWDVGYGLLRIVSSKKREVVFRFYPSLAAVQIWLNGESVFGGRVHFGWDSGRAALKLKRGQNDLLVKMGVQQAYPPLRGLGYYWSLFSRITDAEGEPVRDLKYPLGD
jgi:RNA polymerase sigma-70 factor (ECF subfamily)